MFGNLGGYFGLTEKLERYGGIHVSQKEMQIKLTAASQERKSFVK